MNIVEKLLNERNLPDDELKNLLETDFYDKELFEKADFVRKKYYSNKVFVRGLIEFSNYCKNNCFYCGIRAQNSKVNRYRLTKDEILKCCENGYGLGFRTFVLQSGEDPFFTDKIMVEIIKEIREKYVDCAITLSVGEKSVNTYKKFREAGANRFLLRHETANEEHYAKLHPPEMSLENRKNCLFELKKLGFQVGSGFMVGSPFQTTENLIEDLRFLQKLQPSMIGIGPFISHKDTPFSAKKSGTVALTLRLVAILRLFFPKSLIPATTALGTIAPDGRERGLCAGANVLMPNLSPVKVRKEYLLYDNKICTGEEAAECKFCLERRVKNAGYEIVIDKGDAIN
ncbi:MAG: [FeFe] hydrogenase H-cluster radical SAM maturase HydE [Chitinivibrionia bacterium]|nr:[FeFe] hydrogenase H-cluster radical SAM maturase HydE [Chitinivibrionia bacterium]